MSVLLKINELSGGYGAKKVLHDINISVNRGELVGLIGLNGAGKSTTIKHILGLLPVKSGEVLINGVSLEQDEQTYRKQVAYIPEQPMLYEQLTLREHLRLMAQGYAVEEKQAQERMNHYAERLRMTKQLEWFPSVFSKGMKQKAMILCALVTGSELLIVDEPFVGLDPLAIRELLTIFSELKADGKGILMSTHILETAERHCNRFILLHEGRIAAEGTTEDLRNRYDLMDGSLDDIYVAAIEEAER
ncbi:MAG TPA: multidrug ABC transporter ATP-binding protein [Exiguobacterium sp.]|uniref:ABC transporter ATP-binding protein n=1 Tax=Exiguobacterium sp. TaxID=44751 RepID=UPI000EBB9020|nr:ABC transporter ATP-binding protein [Exiguobacterium sp.]HCN58733.1 multidrug ABC transporter ATP-binding protein [Exiguobacterium sp.]